MIDWNQVDTVLLDMDGTLLDLRFDNHFWLEHLPQRVAELRGVTLEAAKAELFPHMQHIEGTIDWYCLDYWSQALDLDIPALKREVCHLIGFRPQTQAFLDALGRAGKRRVLVTNAHRDSLALKCEHTKLDAHLDKIISAHDFRLPKEHPQFWHELQRVEPFDLERTALLDDTARVLRAARNYGIRHLLGVVQPDSAQPARVWEEFEAVGSFEEIMPALGQGAGGKL
jgi:HAD superfamily hydrolase (TIGR01509 family)